MEIEEFHDRVCRALGQNLMTMNRPAVPEMRRSEASSIDLRYTEIRDFGPITHDEIDYLDGEEWVTIFLTQN